MIEQSFNTDRPYTKTGQLITWKIAKEEPCSIFPEDSVATVLFYDRSRCITGQVLITNIDQQPTYKTEQQIMEQYDTPRGYTQISINDYSNGVVR